MGGIGNTRNQKRPDPLLIKFPNEPVPVVSLGNQGDKEALFRIDQAAAVDEQIDDNPIPAANGMNIPVANGGNL
jgi:hypothetical protein